MSGSGGEIRQRPNGLWEGRFYADGRRRSVYGKTAKETREKLRAALSNADQGIRQAPQRLTVGAYLAEWLAGSVQTKCRPRTIDSYTVTVERYVAPSVGRIALVKLTPEDVGRMVASLTARGTLSPTTVRYAVAVLRIALGRAVKSGLVIRNVASLVDLPARVDRELSPLSADQVATSSRRSTPIAFGRSTSRPSASGCGRANSSGCAGPTSISTRDRDRPAHPVDLDPDPRRTEDGPCPSLSPATDRGARGSSRTPAGPGRGAPRGRREMGGPRLRLRYPPGPPAHGPERPGSLHEHLERAGLPRQRFHDLRHCYATLLLESGEELGVISRTLGHTQISTTANVYTHLTPAMRERTAARMDAILAPEARDVSG